MRADFHDRWKKAMARYKAALTDSKKIAAQITKARRGGSAPDSSDLSKKEHARTKLLAARKAVLVLLRERNARRTH